MNGRTDMRIDMELGSRSYPILVERGCLNRLGSLANLQPVSYTHLTLPTNSLV